MAFSYVFSGRTSGTTVMLADLVGAPNPDSGLYKIFNDVDGAGNAFANAELAVPASDTVAGDYQPGSVQLYQIANAGFASGALLRGEVGTGVWQEYGIASGDLNKVLTVTSDTVGTETFAWVPSPASSITLDGVGGIHVTGSPGNELQAALYGSGTANAVVDGDILVGSGGVYAPLAKGLNGQFVKINDLGEVVWGVGDGGGTVTSVNADSTTGLLVSVANTTTTPLIHINVPGTGTDAAVVAGDMLRGGMGTYEAVALGSSGDVWTVSGGQASWQPLPASLPAGIAVLSSLAAPWTDFVGFIYDDLNITEGTVVNVSSSALINGGSNDREEVGGYLYVVTYPSGFDTHTSPCFVVFSTDQADIGKGVSWSISTYNGIINN